MSPTRRYLRISPHSVLEVRIYLDNPADAGRWLLREREPALPRIVQAVRPLVLPKLREENEREKARKKGQKGGGKKGIKDVVVGDDFDVSIFLTELSTPHSILTRQKLFDPKTERIKSNSGKMTGTRDDPMNIDEGEGVLLREERQEEGKVDLGDIPPAAAAAAAEAEIEAEAGGRQEKLFVSDSEDDDDLDNSGSDDEDGFQTQAAPPKRPKASNTTSLTNPTESKDDKKKMGLKTSYDGFRIYGRILCLVVKRKGGRGAVEGGAGGGGGGGKGKEMMEQFISTQLQNEGVGAGE